MPSTDLPTDLTVSRRKMLQLAAAGAVGLSVGGIVGMPSLSLAAPKEDKAEPGNTSDGKLILGSPLTHSDWMLHPGAVWGAAGIRPMLDACRACGWSRVYWRVCDGGRAMYASKVLSPADNWDADSFWSPQSAEDRALVKRFDPNMSDQQRAAILEKLKPIDYTHFDSLKEAVAYGHEIGLEIHAWVTINEDDHGWGLASRYAKEHPDFRRAQRDGRKYRSQMSFSYPEVQEYKLAIIDELLSGYAIDGLLIDWIRTGDVRDNPQTDADGVAFSGYEPPNVEAFKAKFGVDPQTVANGDERWVRVRAEPQTIFMRALRERVRAAEEKSAKNIASKTGKKLPIAVMVAHPWHYRGFGDKIDGNLRGLLLDVKAWSEEGLIDSAVAAGYYRDGGTAEMAYKALREETGEKAGDSAGGEKSSRPDVWLFGWVPNTVAEFERDAAAARTLGAKELLLWEADYIAARVNAPELMKAMSAQVQ